MKKNEEYWLNLYNEGKIEIDFENGIVYSWLSGHKHVIGNNASYGRSSAGPSRKERYHILLHRFIWICANGDIPKDIEINHKNGDKRDNRLENLELVTKSGNALHSRRVLGNKGGNAFGEDSPSNKLMEWQVREIRRSYCPGIVKLIDLANMFNVTTSLVSAIVRNKVWKELI